MIDKKGFEFMIQKYFGGTQNTYSALSVGNMF